MLARELMSESVETRPAETDLATAAELMVKRGIGSVVVTRDGNPAGIVTETDAIHAGAVTDRPFREIALREVASHPLVTAGPGETVRDCVRRMRTNDVKKLPVVEGPELVGILTMTDVVHGYNDIVDHARQVEADRERWESTGGL